MGKEEQFLYFTMESRVLLRVPTNFPYLYTVHGREGQKNPYNSLDEPA
jgi:hypothetical protein